jgi:hypothetical protein
VSEHTGFLPPVAIIPLPDIPAESYSQRSKDLILSILLARREHYRRQLVFLSRPGSTGAPVELWADLYSAARDYEWALEALR